MFLAQQFKAGFLEGSGVFLEGRDVALLQFVGTKLVFQRAAECRETVVHVNVNADAARREQGHDVAGAAHFASATVAVPHGVYSQNEIERAGQLRGRRAGDRRDVVHEAFIFGDVKLDSPLVFLFLVVLL